MQDDSSNAPRFEVRFSDCQAGWIYMSVRAGERYAEDIVLSQVNDPIVQLLAWLEALAAGLSACAFDFDDENHVVRISACPAYADPGMRLIIEQLYQPANEPPIFDAIVSRKSIVFGFYAALVAFSESDAYLPVEWEGETDWSEHDIETKPTHGLPWHEMRSQVVEAWLALPDFHKPYRLNHWQRWLKAYQYR
jgi:hypothetical protein